MKLKYCLLYLTSSFTGFFLQDLVGDTTQANCTVPFNFFAWSRRGEELPGTDDLEEVNESNGSELFLTRVPEEEVKLDKLPEPFLCDPLEHVIAISTPDAGEAERQPIIDEFNKAGIENYSFFPAAKLNDEQLKREMAQHQQVEKHANIETLARALSHRRVHEKIIAEGWSCALIFEDHAKLARNFSQRLQEVARDSFPAFDVIHLGKCSRKILQEPKDQDTVPTLHNEWLGSCAHAYVASIYGAVAMSQANRPIVMAPEDLWAGTHSFEDRYRKFMDHHRLTGSYWHSMPPLSWPAPKA